MNFVIKVNHLNHYCKKKLMMILWTEIQLGLKHIVIQNKVKEKNLPSEKVR